MPIRSVKRFCVSVRERYSRSASAPITNEKLKNAGQSILLSLSVESGGKIMILPTAVCYFNFFFAASIFSSSSFFSFPSGAAAAAVPEAVTRNFILSGISSFVEE